MMLAAALFALTLGAAEVQLGPETAISPPGAIGPATGWQYYGRVASNGRGFVAVWYDTSSRTIEAVPVNEQGVVETNDSTTLASGVVDQIEIASDGDHYVVVWTDETKLYSMRVDEDARAITTPRVLGARGAPLAIGSDGSSYLLAAGTGRMLLLDRDGAAVRPHDATVGDVLWIGAPRGSYEIIDSRTVCAGNACATQFFHTTTASVGSSSGQTLLATDEGRDVTAAAVATSDAIALVSGTKFLGTPTVRIFGRPAQLRATHTIPHGFEIRTLGAAWDGEQFGFFAAGDANTELTRVTADGVQLGKVSLGRTAYSADVPHVASSGGRELVVDAIRNSAAFDADADVAARSVNAFSELASTTPSVLSLARSPKGSPQLARRGDDELAAWIDERTKTIEGTVNGVPFALEHSASILGPFAVAAGDNVFVITWYEAPVSGVFEQADLRASRIDFHGRVLDRLLVKSVRFSEHEPAVAYGGGTFLFATDDAEGTLHFLRMRETGAPELVRTLEEFANEVDLILPRIAWNGREFVAAYFFLCCSGVTPHVSSVTLRIVRVDGGAPASVTPGDWVWRGPIALAAGPSRLTITAGRYKGIVIAQSARDAMPLSQSPTIVPTEVDPMMALVWNGSEYVLAWTERREVNDSRVYAIRLNAAGHPLDDEPIEIARSTMARPPALAVTSDGVKIAYERVDPASDNAVRIYTRTLRALEVSSRRRPVR